MMVNGAQWALVVYAVLVAVGGVMGYLEKQSKPSLIAGLVSGVMLAACWFIARQTPKAGLALAAVVALALAVFFGIRLAKTGAFMPGGLMLALSVVAVVVFAAGYLSAR